MCRWQWRYHLRQFENRQALQGYIDWRREFDARTPAGEAGQCSVSSISVKLPRVQEDTQRTRDGDRRHILEQELAGEQRNLEQAKKDLAEQEATRGVPSDRVEPYRERVSQHERNIQAIQKELANQR